MRPSQTYLSDIETLGFTAIPDVYASEEVDAMTNLINGADTDKETFRKSADLFAIRQFLKELPEAIELVFNIRLREIISAGNQKSNFFSILHLYYWKPKTKPLYLPQVDYLS